MSTKPIRRLTLEIIHSKLNTTTNQPNETQKLKISTPYTTTHTTTRFALPCIPPHFTCVAQCVLLVGVVRVVFLEGQPLHATRTQLSLEDVTCVAVEGPVLCVYVEGGGDLEIAK